MAQAYCVKDKMKVEVQNPQQITMKNGKPALSGTCPKCGNKVFKIGGCPPRAPCIPDPRRATSGGRSIPGGRMVGPAGTPLGLW